jgi:uncharacterized OsmC-like protein
VADVTGEIETTDDNVLVIRRIHVKYRLMVEELDDEAREKIDRCMEFHPKKCPVARSLEAAVAITTEMDLVVSGSGG